MRKYILKLIDADILQLEKSLLWYHHFISKATFPDNVKEAIEKTEQKILIAKGYRDKFLNERSSVK